MIRTLTAGNFNDTDLQRSQVPLPPAALRVNRGPVNTSRHHSTWQTEQRTRSSRKWPGIISTPLRYPLRPRPHMSSILRPGIPNTHSASIVFTKAVTKRPHSVTKDSGALKQLTSAGDGGAANREPNPSQLVVVTQLMKLMNQSWDLRVSGEHLTGNITKGSEPDSSFEMLSTDLGSRDVLMTEEGADSGLGTWYSLGQSTPPALSPSQHATGDGSAGLLKPMGLQSQTTSLVFYPTIRPTPTTPAHKPSAQTSVVSHGHSLSNSFWMASSSSDWMENPLNTLPVLLRDPFNTETAALSLHETVEFSMDTHHLMSHHSEIKSSSAALSKDIIKSMSSWSYSLLIPGQVGFDDEESIISSPAFERDNNGFPATGLTYTTDLAHFTNHFGTESITSAQWIHTPLPTGTQQLVNSGDVVTGAEPEQMAVHGFAHPSEDFPTVVFSTEDLQNQLEQSDEFVLLPGHFSIRGQGDSIAILVPSTDTDILVMSTKPLKSSNSPNALAYVSSAPSVPDVMNIPSTPDHFWGNFLSPSMVGPNEGVNRSQYNTETLSMAASESSIQHSLSGNVQSVSVHLTVLQTGTQVEVGMTGTPGPIRIPEFQTSYLSPLKAASPSIVSQWTLSPGELSPHPLPDSRKSTERDSNQISLPDITQRITQSHQRAYQMGESTWRTLAPDDAGMLTKDISLMSLSISTESTPETLHLKSGSSAVADNLKSSLETSINNVGDTWAVPLDWTPVVTHMLLPVSFDVSAAVGSETTNSLHPDNLPELEQTFSSTPSSFQISVNGTYFPSFPLTIPEGLQNKWGILSRVSNSSIVASGSQAQERFVTSSVERAKEVQLEHQLAEVSVDNTNMEYSLLGFVSESRVPRASWSPGLKWEPFSYSVLERVKGVQAVTVISVHSGAQWTSLNTHTPLLTRTPQLANADDIVTGAEPEHMADSGSVHSPSDFPATVLTITLTSQNHARTLQYLKPEHSAEEPITYNEGLYSSLFSTSAHISEGISVNITSASVGSPQLSAGPQEQTLVPTLSMGSSLGLSIGVLPTPSSWGNVISTETDPYSEQPLLTSATRLVHLVPVSSSVEVAPPSVPSPDVYGLSLVAPSTGLGSREPSVTPDHASASCLCEEAGRTGCLCGEVVANCMS